MNKYNILYIAKNIPAPPEYEGNDVIWNIVRRLEPNHNIDFLYPNEYVPWWLQFIPKYRKMYSRKPWIYDGKKINLIRYFILPYIGYAFADFGSNKELRRVIENKKYDLIHAHYLLPDALFAYKLSEILNIPFVISIRSHDIKEFKRFWNGGYFKNKLNRVLQKASSITRLSNSSLDFIENQLGISSVLIPHGIGSDWIANLNEIDRINPNCVVINVTANLIARKQVDWVIRAVLEYKGTEKVKVEIVGDGPELERLKSISRAPVEFLGYLKKEEVRQRLIRSDIFCLPSYRESFGLVYLEAAATYNAILGLKGEGPFGLLNSETEMLYSENYFDFKTKLFKLIDDRDFRMELATAALCKVDSFKWSKIIARYVELYQKAITLDKEISL